MEEVRKSTWIGTNWRIWHGLRDCWIVFGVQKLLGAKDTWYPA